MSIAKAVVPDATRKPNQPSLEVVTGRYSFSQLCQVMDSPGLLVRPDDERNEMEALTLAAMQHLPTAVMYVWICRAVLVTSVQVLKTSSNYAER